MTDPSYHDRRMNERLRDPEFLAAYEAEMERLVRRVNERIENCHLKVACPKCGAPVGVVCFDLRSSGPEHLPTKHPHRERWTQVVPAR